MATSLYGLIHDKSIWSDHVTAVGIFLKKQTQQEIAGATVAGAAAAAADGAVLRQLPDGVGRVARAVLVTDEAIVAHRTEAVATAGALEAIFAQAGAIDVVAPGTILAVALMGALGPVGAQGTLLLTPETGGGEGH